MSLARAVRLRFARPACALVALDCLANGVVLAALGRVCGPLVLMPMALSNIGVSYAMVEGAFERRLGLGACGLALLGSLALEAVGALPRSYTFEGGAMVIHPHLAALSPGWTLGTLTNMAVLGLFLSRSGSGSSASRASRRGARGTSARGTCESSCRKKRTPFG